MIFLEKFLNHYIHLDPASKDRSKKLYDKKILIHLLGIDCYLLLIFQSDGAHLTLHSTLPMNDADVVIRATPLSLLQLKLSKNRRALFAKTVTIEGDMVLAQQLSDFFDGIEVDWEEYFSKIVGDFPAHQTGKIIHHFKKSAASFYEKFTTQLNEYLHEEMNFFPPKEALQDFYQDIDDFRLHIDRLSVRIKQLEKRL